MRKIKLNRENGIQLGGKTFISLLKEKIDYSTNVTLDKKYVLYKGGIIDMGIRKLS